MYKKVKVERQLLLALLLCITIAAFISLVMLVSLEHQRGPYGMGAQTTGAQTVDYQYLTDAEKQVYIQEIKTREAWRTGVSQAISVSDEQEDKVKGASKFTACFLSDEACVAKSRAYRDEFNKVSFYFAPDSYTLQLNQVNFYLSLYDEAMPQLLMRFSYVGDSWLYIEGALVIADGELVLDKSFPAPHLRREILESGSVYEFADVVMNADLMVIEKMAAAETISVLLRGEGGKKAYLDEVSLDGIILQAQQILTMYQLLNTSLENALKAVKAVEEPAAKEVESSPNGLGDPVQAVEPMRSDEGIDPVVVDPALPNASGEATNAVAKPIEPVATENNGTAPAPTIP